MSERDALILQALRKQAENCAAMGSPIYGDLLVRCADDFAASGVVAQLLADWGGHPVLDNIALRLLGAAHFLALRGDAPALAASFPSTGGRYDAPLAWMALRETFESERARIRAHLDEQIQTNEVRRCCALLGGFLALSRAHEWPLGLLEIGASAGLNQCFDQYRYALGAQRFGPIDAPLALDCEWRGKPLELAGPPLRVASRRGCDLFPIDLRVREQRLRLESFFWPDQLERIARLRAACDCALRSGVELERARAGDWLARELAAPAPRTTTVLFHSVMWLYVPEDERTRIRDLMSEAGERATAETPLAWLSMEGHNYEFCEIRLRTWPGGEDRLLGRCHYHGAWVEWS
ncbi:MAG TPA: DUF2332 domain-containing protein [Myxococcota bacterium]|nr:DUF2332 domain-containing protein [Myxococcota bacterium]